MSGRRRIAARRTDERGAKHDWTSPQLIERVRAFNAALEIDSDSDGPTDAKPAFKPLTPKRGTAGLYRVVARDGALAVDVGFKLYLPLTAAQSRGLESGAIVSLEDGTPAAAEDAKATDLFTYRVTVRRVVDGDTLAVSVELPHYVMDDGARQRGDGQRRALARSEGEGWLTPGAHAGGGRHKN